MMIPEFSFDRERAYMGNQLEKCVILLDWDRLLCIKSYGSRHT